MIDTDQEPSKYHATLSLIINSGIYRHHTLRKRIHDVFCKTGSLSAWDTLNPSHWEILYYLIECRLCNRTATITDIPLGTGVPPSTSRRVLRQLEEIGLATTTCDEADKRRYNTELANEYHQVVDDFVADYTGGFAGLIQKHDKQERDVAQAALERTREELIESEARLVEAQGLASIGHWVWDEVHDKYLTLSSELLRIYGVTDTAKYDHTGRWQNRFTHPEDVDRIVAVETDAVKHGVGYESEYRIVRPDGVIRYVREIGASRQDGKGRPISATGTTQDITDLKQIERALRESDQRYRDLFDHAEVSIWEEDFSEVYRNLEQLRQSGVKDLRRYLGDNGQAAREMAASVNVNRVNNATLKLFKAKSHAEFISSIDNVFGPHTLTIFTDELCAIWQQEPVFYAESDHKTLDGDDLTVLISMPIPTTEAESRNVTVSIVDITERKQSEEKYRNIFDTSTAGIGRSRITDGKILLANNRLAEIFGYDSVQAFTDDFKFSEHYTTPDARERELEHRRNNPGNTYEVSMTQRDGTVIHVRGDAQLNDKSGFMDFVVIDITDNKLAERQLKDSLAEKEMLVRVMACIHDSLHHSDYLGAINAEAYLNTLVDDLKASIGNDTDDISFRVSADDLTMDVDQAIPCGQIVNELIYSSVKHAFPDGHPGNIGVSLHRADKGMIELIVTDDGKGIPKDLDFDKSNSLCLKLVKELRGTIDIDGSNGTRIQIIFPETTS